MTSQSPLVSIIMPVYNGESFLKEAIDSIVTQTYTNWELIVVNDGSTDGSRDIVLSYTDPRIQLHDNEENLGIISTKNKAIDIAKGKYIASLDADDIALPTRLAKQVEYFETHSDCGLVATLHQEIDGNGKRGQVSLFPTSNRDVHSYLLLANCICHSSTMLRADLMKELKYIPGFHVAEDYEMWDRITNTHFIANIPEVLTLYRVHGNNISITKKSLMFETVKTLSKRMLNNIKIEFTPRQHDLHCDLVSFSNELTKDKKSFDEMEEWVISFLNQMKARKGYNPQLIYKIMAERYIVACAKHKRYVKLFFNKIMKESPSAYLNIVFHKLRGKDISYNNISTNK